MQRSTKSTIATIPELDREYRIIRDTPEGQEYFLRQGLSDEDFQEGQEGVLRKAWSISEIAANRGGFSTIPQRDARNSTMFWFSRFASLADFGAPETAGDRQVRGALYTTLNDLGADLVQLDEAHRLGTEGWMPAE